MSIQDVITLVDAVKPNGYDLSTKVKWLNLLDGIIHRDIIQTHDGWDGEPFVEYTGEEDLKRELLVSTPFNEFYRWYLEMQIDKANGEMSAYNNSNMMFVSAYTTFTDNYNRTHRPLGQTALKLY